MKFQIKQEVYWITDVLGVKTLYCGCVKRVKSALGAISYFVYDGENFTEKAESDLIDNLETANQEFLN